MCQCYKLVFVAQFQTSTSLDCFRGCIHQLPTAYRTGAGILVCPEIATPIHCHGTHSEGCGTTGTGFSACLAINSLCLRLALSFFLSSTTWIIKIISNYYPVVKHDFVRLAGSNMLQICSDVLYPVANVPKLLFSKVVLVSFPGAG